ncbi:hypothetical protein HCJ66_04635 [Listeria sp. FSL L7-1582]|uniref:CRISPR-associated protein Csn2-St n=1 Tax=Listeria portnoyi TaxID=2713504 RepID=UPI00164E069E|nr:CRISPR-associated protein Csn2-St [Listeria portnoyi]MBC6308839.1 hypothetical protein [Listeria portnoyi]
MNLWTFSHPKLAQIEMNFGQLMQVVGDNSELKQQLWQNLSWFLSKHKYTEAELSILQYKEPEIFEDGQSLSRNKFQTLIIESVTDIHDLLNVKKGTPIFEMMNRIIQNLDITKNIEAINYQLDEIARKMNADGALEQINSGQNIEWGILVEEINALNLLQKNVSMLPEFQDLSYAIEYIDGYSKYLLLLEILNINLENSAQPILLMIKNIDDTLHYDEYEKIMRQIEILTERHPHFFSIIFPSQIGYVYVSERYIENILVAGREVHALVESEVLYERVCNNYPDMSVPSYVDFMNYLKTVAPYLFTNKKQSIQMSLRELVLIKIINELFCYYDFEAGMIDTYTQLEYEFLYSE